MEFGMPTLLALESLEENAALCARLRLAFVEINMNLPEYQVHVLRKHGLPRPGGIFYTLHLDENLNPFDFNPLVRSAYLQTTLDAIAFAREQCIPVLNMHMPQGVYFTLPGRKMYLFDRYYDAFITAVREFRTAVAQEIGGSGVKICLENTVFSGMPRLRSALEVLLEADCFHFTYDAGHDHSEGGAARAFYQKHQTRLAHIHLHDAGSAGSHLPLGQGDVDKTAVLETANRRNCRVVLETKSPEGLLASVQWLQERNYMA